MKKSICIFILLFVLNNCFAQSHNRTSSIVLIALMGQSNMSGRGKITNENEKEIPDRIYVYKNSSKIKKAKPPIDSSFRERNRSSKDKRAGYDLAMGAGWYFYENTKREVVFIPCAKGGSSISQWIRSSDSRSLYGNCLIRIKRMQSKFNVKLSAIFFYQGESDGLKLESATNYGESFFNFIGSIRTDLQNSNLPFIYAQLSKKAPKIPYWDIVKANQSINVDNTYMLKTDHFTHNEDQLHLDAQSLHTLGEDFAKTYLRNEHHLAH